MALRLGQVASVVGLVMSAWAGTAVAAPSRNQAPLCAASEAVLAKNFEMRDATKALFGDLAYAKRDEDCVYPQQLVRFGGADVLVALGAAPGNCHGCPGEMSAFVFRRTPDGLRLSARFPKFGSSGSFGAPARIDPIQIAGDDALAIEGGGTFQGYTHSVVQFFVFRGGKLVALSPALSLAGSNGGAKENAADEVTVKGAWSVGATKPNEIAIDYQVELGGRKTGTSRAIWEIQGGNLILKSGEVPPEMKDASGG